MPSISRFYLLLLLLLAGCSTAPAFTIPDPLPEALEWARPSVESTGSFLGLKTRENDSGSLDALFFEPGVRVVRVIENSPAEEAGFEAGDVLIDWSGSEVNDPAALETLVQATAPGSEVQAKVQRDDTVFAIPVTVRPSTAGAISEAEILYHRDPSRSIAGWANGGGGALLVASQDSAPFPRAGIPVGSVVLGLEGRQVLSARDLIRRLQSLAPGSAVEIRFKAPGAEAAETRVELQDEEIVVTGITIPILLNYTDDLERDLTEFVLIDLYLISLFSYTRQGAETEYRFLRWIKFSTGSGELSE